MISGMPPKYLTFIHTEEFDASLDEIPLSDDELAKAQAALQANPEAGDSIVGTGGVRKLRVAAKGKGKSGGARFLYYYIVKAHTIYLLLAYSKSDFESVSDAGKQVLRGLSKKLDSEHS
ncbi:type II toxin-antitoxin system RelE/ParE family toxin [Gemmatimonas sp.]|uniref:type II toxin-antitoxin system RelE/ParE family toxin n=1 Tax=Gemmatimonas sp. TaxID=1962908 RepID=UPI00286B4A9E|nr:type II toxin-antitoxin system RelE/ParE family toxin [Gemmatimonas sp.]